MKRVQFICLCTVLVSVVTPLALAFPPDNAAVLYYKAFVIYRPDDHIGNMLMDYIKGRIDLNDEIRQHVEDNRIIIRTLNQATNIDQCDWGLDISENFEMNIPHLSLSRRASYLLLVQSKVLAEKGDIEGALEQLLALKRMVHHVRDQMLISFLVGYSINNLANETLQDLLRGSFNAGLYRSLRDDLSHIDAMSFNIRNALVMERDHIGSFATKEGFMQMMDGEPMEGRSEPVQQAYQMVVERDEAFFQSGLDYWKDMMTQAMDILQRPYVQAYPALQELESRPLQEFESHPEAAVVVVLWPTLSKIYHYQKQMEASNRALRIALELYLQRARTGQLPQTLPDYCPTDPFSDLPFLYEVTDQGFMLRCQGQDLFDGTTAEYEFDCCDLSL